MAPPSQSDLVKIGMEGFSLIDQYFGRKPTAMSHQPTPLPAGPDAQRATAHAGFQTKPRGSCYYQPQEPQVVRVSTRDYTIETVIMLRAAGAGRTSSYERAAPQIFRELSY